MIVPVCMAAHGVTMTGAVAQTIRLAVEFCRWWGLTGQDEDRLRQELAAALASASASLSATVLDLTDSGVVTFHIGVHKTGTPDIHKVHRANWESVNSGGSLPVPSGTLIIVRSADTPSASAALGRLRAARPDVPTWDLPGIGISVGDLLAEAVRDSPIRLDHELIAVQVDESGNRIRLTSTLLFPAGAKRGDETSLNVRASAGGRPMVLAVVARDGSTPHLLKADEVLLESGSHEIRAVLLGPGQVQFWAPPTSAHAATPFGGNLSDLIATVPETLNSVERAHLICAVEISGSASRVAARLYLAERLIKSLCQQLPQKEQLVVSVIGYGAHRFTSETPDNRVLIGTWMRSPGEALRSLGWMGAADLGYPHAAQVEDMLVEVLERLPPEDGSRPIALLILGDRPPHPPSASGGLLPCPLGHDWQQSMDSLASRTDVFVGAIRDDLSAPGTTAWADLGAAKLQTPDSVDAYKLWQDADLVVLSPRNIPFPIID